MTDEEFEAHEQKYNEELEKEREHRRVEKVEKQKQAKVGLLMAQKREVEAQRHAVLQAAVELGARTEKSKQTCALLLLEYDRGKAKLRELEAQVLAKQQQEQGLAKQVASLEVQIDALLKNCKQPAVIVAQDSNAGKTATYAVRISGATGINAGFVNGLYEVTDEVSGGMPVYKKQEAEMWLEYHASTSRWLSRPTTSKGQERNDSHASVDCDSGVLPDEAPIGAWKVGNGFSFSAQESIIVSPMSAADVAAEKTAVQAACEAARETARHAVRISGATGNNAALVNGLFELTGEISGGMPVYKKQGDEQWLEYFVSTCRWMSRSTARKGQTNNSCHAYVDCAICVLPDEAPTGAWQVANGVSFGVQANIVVSPMSAEQVVAEAAAVQAACAAARAAAMYAVRICGATGKNSARVNGVYEVTGEVSRHACLQVARR